MPQKVEAISSTSKSQNEMQRWQGTKGNLYGIILVHTFPNLSCRGSFFGKGGGEMGADTIADFFTIPGPSELVSMAPSAAVLAVLVACSCVGASCADLAVRWTKPADVVSTTSAVDANVERTLAAAAPGVNVEGDIPVRGSIAVVQSFAEAMSGKSSSYSARRQETTLASLIAEAPAARTREPPADATLPLPDQPLAGVHAESTNETPAEPLDATEADDEKMPPTVAEPPHANAPTESSQEPPADADVKGPTLMAPSATVESPVEAPEDSHEPETEALAGSKAAPGAESLADAPAEPPTETPAESSHEPPADAVVKAPSVSIELPMATADSTHVPASEAEQLAEAPADSTLAPQTEPLADAPTEPPVDASADSPHELQADHVPNAPSTPTSASATEQLGSSPSGSPIAESIYDPMPANSSLIPRAEPAAASTAPARLSTSAMHSTASSPKAPNATRCKGLPTALRVLFVDDAVRPPHAGSGYGRARAMHLSAARLGHSVTVFPWHVGTKFDPADSALESAGVRVLYHNMSWSDEESKSRWVLAWAAATKAKVDVVIVSRIHTWNACHRAVSVPFRKRSMPYAVDARAPFSGSSSS